MFCFKKRLTLVFVVFKFLLEALHNTEKVVVRLFVDILATPVQSSPTELPRLVSNDRKKMNLFDTNLNWDYS